MPDNPFRRELERRQGPAAANPFRAELETRQRNAAARAAGGSALEAAGSEFFSGFVNNLLAVPSASGDLAAAGGAVVEGIVGKARGEDFAFGERYERGQGEFPANVLRAIPRPTVQDLAAAGRSVPALLPGGETPGDAFTRNRADIEAEQAARRGEHPLSSAAGGIAGDIATLITGRAPIANLVRQAELKLAAPRVPELMFGAAARSGTNPGLLRVANRALLAEGPRKLARGAGRAVETGLEGAVLEVLKGENADPLTAAAMAAGGQTVGSALLGGAKGVLSGGLTQAGLKLTLLAGSVAGLWQLGKSATPGGRDRILESIETGYDKVAFGLMLGAAAAMAGAGRWRSGQIAEDLPRVMDGLAAVPRGATLSFLTDIVNGEPEQQATYENVLMALAENPSYRGSSAAERAIVDRIREAAGVTEEDLAPAPSTRRPHPF